jgi:BirA family transcriptional regulator, biotin operon repressor / biotin---[acetyl-CoA-carboxylase] ligase
MAQSSTGAAASAAIDQPWTDIRSELGARTPSRNAIAAAALEALLPALAAFERDGLAPTLGRYLHFDALRGQSSETRGGAEPLFGIADGLADDGALRLRTASGEVLLRAGEVSVRPA